MTMPSASMSSKIVTKMKMTAAGRPAGGDVIVEEVMPVREDVRKSNTVYDFTAKTLDGRAATLGQYAGSVLLIVNVASRCGLTPQYRELEGLYRQYRAAGFVVLGFPCNQFGAQEPGSHQEIRSFCEREYDVTFPVFAKVAVNGPRADPLFTFLKAQRPGWLGIGAIKWNFTKFLVDRAGRPIARFGPRRRPADLAPAIEGALAFERDAEGGRLGQSHGE
jgi:glutathione peroxidase